MHNQHPAQAIAQCQPSPKQIAQMLHYHAKYPVIQRIVAAKGKPAHIALWELYLATMLSAINEPEDVLDGSAVQSLKTFLGFLL